MCVEEPTVWARVLSASLWLGSWKQEEGPCSVHSSDWEAPAEPRSFPGTQLGRTLHVGIPAARAMALLF